MPWTVERLAAEKEAAARLLFALTVISSPDEKTKSRPGSKALPCDLDVALKEIKRALDVFVLRLHSVSARLKGCAST